VSPRARKNAIALAFAAITLAMSVESTSQRPHVLLVFAPFTTEGLPFYWKR
jgi:hypothetical protein